MPTNSPDDLVREIVFEGSTRVDLVKGEVGFRMVQFLEWLAGIPDWQAREIDDLRIQYHAHLYRVAQAGKIISVFTATYGRPPHDSAELEKWMVSLEGAAALASHTGPDGKILP